MIARRFLLLVAVLLLLIDDDQAEIFERRKNGRTRADHDARLAVAHAPPFARTLDIAESGVEHGYAFIPRAEPRAAEPPDPECQRNFRHKHDCCLFARERFLDAAQVHFRFAAAGHAEERSEEHTSELQSLAYLVCRLLLEKKKIFSLVRIQ